MKAKVMEMLLKTVEIIPPLITNISTDNLGIQAQIDKSGGSGDGGDIFRLSIVRIVTKNRLALDGTKEAELLLLLSILIKSDKP